MTTAVSTLSADQELVSKELNSQIQAVLSNKVEGFQKAFIVSSAIGVLKERLSTEYMKPILALQGSRLGFLTDKDKSGGYPEEVVKNCLVDAVLLGLQPTGNEFNIIGGNMYPTKEGFGSLLKNLSGLRYNLTFKNPTISADKSTANCIVTIDYEFNHEKQSQTIDFPIKCNAYMSADALIGKATRKSRAWLFNYLSGTDITDGDVQDVPHVDVTPKQTSKEVSAEKETARIEKHIEKSKFIEELERCKPAIPASNTDLVKKYNDRASEILSALIPTLTVKEELIALKDKLPNDDFDLVIMYDDKLRELSK